MKSERFSIKLRRFVILSMSVTFILTTVFILVFSYSANRTNLIALGRNQLDLIKLNLENEIYNIERSSLGLMFNSSIQNALLHPHILESYEEHNIITYVLSDHRNFSNPSNVVLFDGYGNMLTSSEGYSSYCNIFDANFFSELEASNGEGVWIAPHIDSNDYKTPSTPVISLAQKIRYLDINIPENSGRVIGYILINIDVSEFYDILQSSNWFPEGQLELEMSDGAVVASWGNNVKGAIPIYVSLNEYGWKITDSIPLSEIFNIPLQMLLCVFAIEMLLISFFSYLASKQSKNMTGPLNRLENAMKRQDLEKVTSTFSHTGIIELDSMQCSYDRMIERLSDLSQILMQKQIKEKELEYASVAAELSALQHQINPHFLYNTLDSINWMAMAAGVDDISEMITHLASFLRFHTRARGTVSIKQELENASDYIYIQKIRYGSRLSYLAEYDETLLDFPVIPLIIQPIVENSIVHCEDEQCINVHVSVFRNENKIVIRVKDNGSGIPSEKLADIRNRIQTGESIGLSNVSKRLKLFYGSQASLVIESLFSKGTEVTIAIPDKSEKN